MYFAIGWPTCMKMEQTDSKLVYISCNLERSLFVILTEDSISLWYYKVNNMSKYVLFINFIKIK